jgi:hypothetical protein
MGSRVLMLCLGLLLNAAPMFSQLYYCGPIKGNWKWGYDNSEYDLSQDNSGNITGLYLTPFCPGYTFPITGTITSGSFTLHYYRPYQVPNHRSHVGNIHGISRPTGLQLCLRKLEQLSESLRRFRPKQCLSTNRRVRHFHQTGGCSDQRDFRAVGRVEHHHGRRTVASDACAKLAFRRVFGARSIRIR